jgi:uncharacterized repeat protein (TIGR01451 family)
MNAEEIFHDALARPQAERPAFLGAACAGDEPLQRRIQALLDAHENPGSFLAVQPPSPVATIDEPVLERPGTVIGPYKLLEQIGEGGFGVVFMAEQTEPVRRKVALKVLKPGMDTRQVVARFEAERQALAIMDHPNIAKVHDGGATPTGRPYFVMELVKGVPITEFCDQNQLTPRPRLELFVPVCQAVQHALEHESKARSVDLPIGTLGPNESRTVPLVLTATQEGKLVNRVTATADGGLKDQAEHPVVVQKAQVSLQIKGPPRRFVGRPADWDIRVVNTGEAALTNVVLRHRLPPELGFASATEGGQLVQGQVEWRLGTLAPRQEKTVRVTTTSNQITPAAISVAVVTADAGLIKEEKASLEILGTPAYRFQVTPSGNPVEIGKQINYVITVENTGSQAANDVEIAVVVPPELRLVKVSGPSKETIAGQNITFAKVSGVKPAQTLTYTIQVEGVKQGDVRFRAELRGETLTSPVLKEAPTTIYDPQAPLGPPPMGPAPMAPPPMGPAPLPVK